jgi:hypothetical protein
MEHPEITKMNAELRYDQLLKEAQAYRRARTLSGKNHSWLHAVVQIFFPVKSHHEEIRSDAPKFLKSAS